MKNHLVQILTSLLLVLFFLPVVSVAQSKADCMACHSDASLTKERNGKQVSLQVREAILNNSPHKKLVCIACHTGFDPNNVPHKDPITPVNCITCHKDAGANHPFHPQIAQALKEGSELDVSCKDCHGTHDVVSPKISGSKFSHENIATACNDCHGDVVEHFAASAHGKAVEKKIQGAPNCLTCHTNSALTAGSDTASTAKIAQEKLCLSCHLDNPDVRARTSPTAGFIAAYEQSVHGRALLSGNDSAANCVDCHGSHDMKKGVEPSSLVSKQNIPQTCAKCHTNIATEFSESIHGKAIANGNTDAPVCTDCHGEHNILKHTDPRSPVAKANVSRQVCTPCHESVKLTSKYGIASDRTETFSDSYHGLALRGGDVEAANCASCHGVHNIKPSNDSTSTISKARLVETCGKCHPGANQKFAVGAVHVAMTAQEDPTLYWISTIYVVLIVGTIGGMFVHNMLDFRRKARRKLMIRRQMIPNDHHDIGNGLYVRMTLNERIQHGSLAISFILLVITGFMLRYPEAWWVQSIRNLSDSAFQMRSLLHRISGVILIAVSLYHVYYIIFTARGKQLIRDLMPVMQDAKDMMAVLKYNIGKSNIKPKFGRFSYIEKSEYWALIWGTVVMAFTGVIMWFDNTFMGTLTKHGYDIARTIHYYEAWLATLAIIVWHFYFVIFNPDAYPLNLAFLKGTLSEEEMHDEHPLELEEIRRKKMEEELKASASDADDNELSAAKSDELPGSQSKTSHTS